MKLSEYYSLPGVRTVAFVIGAIACFVTSLFAGWIWGALVGCVAVLLLALILPLILYRQDLPYIRIKNTLEQPLLIDERVYYFIPGGSIGGFFLLTQNSIILLSMEKGKHRMELLREDVRSLSLADDMSISIYLNDTKYIRFATAAYEEVYDILRRNGW